MPDVLVATVRGVDLQAKFDLSLSSTSSCACILDYVARARWSTTEPTRSPQHICFLVYYFRKTTASSCICRYTPQVRHERHPIDAPLLMCYKERNPAEI
eukprot:2988712-Amphidinium_carterae.1